MSNVYRLGGTDGNSKTGPLHIGGTSLTNGNNLAGLNIDQGASDDEVLTLQSSDVAHGMTSQTQTNSYFFAGKQSATLGGVMMTGVTESAVATEIRGFATTPDTAHTTLATGAILLNAWKRSGTNIATLATNENALVVASASVAKFIVDADGDMFNDGASGTSTTYDDAEDVALVETLSALLAPARVPNFRYRLAGNLAANARRLEEGGVVTLKADGTVDMFSYKGTLGLLFDTLRQEGFRLRALMDVLGVREEVERRLAAR